MPGEQRSGDTGVIRHEGKLFAVTLIDVLGHGNEAANLADDIKQALYENEILPPLAVIEYLHKQFRGSRGMVASSALLQTDTGMLEYSGVGNIVARTFGPRAHQFVNRDGVVGYRMVSPVAHTRQLAEGDIFAMYSDGITSRFSNQDIFSCLNLPAEKIADHLMNTYSKGSDDSSCMVVKVNPCQ